MRIAVFAIDLPYPPNQGGRADIWRRLLQWHARGVEVALICWVDGTPDPEAMQTVRSCVQQLHVYPIRRGPREALIRALMLPVAPSHVAARRLSGTERRILEKALAAFAPDAVWIDSVYPARAAIQLARALKRPYFYRSHNIEHRYMARQARAARQLRDSLAWSVATLGLKRFELYVMREARFVFDVSADDLSYWRARGIGHIRQLLPLPSTPLDHPYGDRREASREVVFLGNLSRPNNIEGIEWLLLRVRPLVEAARPGTRWTLAGSAPVAHVRQLVEKLGSVELLCDIADAEALLFSAAVLVNPVQTGSGVMVKMLDMLMTDAPIVSSPQGLAGLPQEMRVTVRMETTAEAFARAIVDELRDSSVQRAQRARARSLLWADTGSQLLEELERLCLPAHAAVATAS
jgi:polysaccharide biosynthesis protein PslH